MKSNLLLAALLAAIAGCKSVPPPKQPLDAGPKPTQQQAEQAVREFLGTVLKDPDSLKQFELYAGPYLKEHQDTRWSPWKVGWLVCFRYNAKNSYGGYVGVKANAVYLMGHEAKPYVIEVVPEVLVSTYCPG